MWGVCRIKINLFAVEGGSFRKGGPEEYISQVRSGFAYTNMD